MYCIPKQSFLEKHSKIVFNLFKYFLLVRINKIAGLIFDFLIALILQIKKNHHLVAFTI
jgi:hypothetical protein